MLSLADVLDLPVVRRALPEVVIGQTALDRDIRWAHVIEMPEPDDLLKGGELVLTTGLGASADPAAWTASLVGQGMAALAVELGSTWRDVPPTVVAGCARAGVPVIAFHRPVRFIEITEGVHGAVVNAQFALLARGEEIHRRFTELILRGRGVPEILAELCAAVKNPVLLEDAGGSLVYYVSGPPGDDLALSRVGGRAPRRGPRRGGRGRVRGRGAAAGLELGAADGALAGEPARRLRPRGRGARRARRGHRPALPAARRAAARPVARRVPVRAVRRARGGARRAPARRGARLPRHRPRRAAARGRGLAAPGVRAGEGARRLARRPRERRDGVTWTRLSGDLRTALASTGLAVLLGPRDVDLLVLLALGARGYDEALVEHVAHLFHGALDRHGLGPADAALAVGGVADSWAAAGQGLRRVRRSAGAATSLPVKRWYDARRPGLADLLHELRDTPELETFVEEQLGPLIADGSPRTRVLLETLEAYLAAGGRKAEAARALHLERQSLYLRLHRIEEALGVSLDDEDVVLGLHLAVRARRFRRGARST